MPSLSKWLWQIEPRRPAMARAAGPADGRRIETQFFWGFERSRRATGSLTNSPTLSRIATIGFILAATVSRWSAPGSARIICLIVLLGHKRTAATHEHNRACRSRITRCARSATAAADRWVFDAAPRQRVGTGRHRTETEPARYRHSGDSCRKCIWRKADTRSDLPPGHVQRLTARHRTHPWRRLRDGRAGNEGCRK